MAGLNAMSLPGLVGSMGARLRTLGTDRRLPLLATLVAIVLLAQGLALLTWQLLPAPELDDTALATVTPVASSVKTPAKQSPNPQQIARWHLFGELQKAAPKPAVTTMTEAPDTSLNLKLSGVLASSDPRMARAIIADAKGKEDAYAVGEGLPGNAVLREIYADRVILEYRGRLETLRLPKEPSKGTFASARPAAARGSGGAVNNAETAGLLRQYRSALTSDPQSLMNLVRTSPVTDKATGRLKGFKVFPGKDRELLGKFGLKAGDVVTGVNGVALDNPIKGLEIMRDLSTANSVTLDVERNGVMQSFSFQVD